MRDFKFRVWDKFTEKMVFTGFSIIGEITVFSLIDQYCHKYPNDKLDSPKSFERWHDFVVMQFTGLKDKNGTEIYESDLLIDPRDFEIGNNPHQVIFNQNIAAYGWFHTPMLQEEKFYSLNRFLESLEVIGNIYQNPELLIIKGE